MGKILNFINERYYWEIKPMEGAAFLVSVISFILLIFLDNLKKDNVVLIIGNREIVGIILTAIFAASVLYLFIKKSKDHLIVTVAKVISGLVFVGIVGMTAGSMRKYKYYTFESPKGSNTIMVEESYSDEFGLLRFYKKDGGIKTIALNSHINYITLDRHKPFEKNRYEIQWINEKAVVVIYQVYDDGIMKSVPLRL